MRDLMRELIIDITYLCNSNCRYCQWSTSNSGIERKISNQEILVHKKNLLNLGISKIVLTGGEPLLSANLKQVVRYYNNLDFQIRLISNGLILNKEIISEIIDIGVNEFVISLDSISYEVYSMNRDISRTSFQKIMKNLELLSKNEDLFLGLNVVLTSSNCNWENIFEILEYAKERDIKQVKFQPVFDDGFLSKKAPNLQLNGDFEDRIEKIRSNFQDLNLTNKFSNPVGFWTDLIALYSGKKLNPKKCKIIDHAVLLHNGMFKFCFWCEHTNYGYINEIFTRKKIKLIRDKFTENLSKCKVYPQCFCLQPIDHEWT